MYLIRLSSEHSICHKQLRNAVSRGVLFKYTSGRGLVDMVDKVQYGRLTRDPLTPHLHMLQVPFRVISGICLVAAWVQRTGAAVSCHGY